MNLDEVGSSWIYYIVLYALPKTTARTNTCKHIPNILAIISRTLNFSHVLLLFWLEPSRLATKNIIQMKIVYFAIFTLFFVSSFRFLVYNFSPALCFSNSVDFIALFWKIKKEM